MKIKIDFLCSYEGAGLLISKFVPAWRIKVQKYFSLLLFNFLFSDGDAHLKISPYWNHPLEIICEVLPTTC
jgi:hypothetical protein